MVVILTIVSILVLWVIKVKAVKKAEQFSSKFVTGIDPVSNVAPSPSAQ